MIDRAKAVSTDQVLVLKHKIWTVRLRIGRVAIFQASVPRISNAAALIALVAVGDLAAIASAVAAGLAAVIASGAVEDSVAAALVDSVAAALAGSGADDENLVLGILIFYFYNPRIINQKHRSKNI